MPIPPPPPPPPGPPPPPTFSQANTEPPKLSRDEQKGRGALLNDICKGARLKKVAAVNDRSAPVLEKSKGGGGGSAGYGSSAGGALQPKGGLFQGGVPKLRPVGTKDNSESPSGRSPQVPSTRSQAPRPPVSVGRHQDDSESSSNRSSPPEMARAHRPSLPDLTRPPNSTSPGMKHSSSAPPPPGRRVVGAPPTPSSSSSSSSSSQTSKPYNRGKPLPPTPVHRAPAAPPVKPPPSPVNVRTTTSQPPPPPPYRQPPASLNGPPSPINDLAPELPQRHNSLHRKTVTPVRGLAPPPPPSANLSPGGNRPPPPARDPPGRGAAPPPPVVRNGGRDAPPPPPPPYRMHGVNETSQNRAKPPPPPSRTPSGPPPPPPPVRNGHRESVSIGRSFADDFESKYSFHAMDEFPAPEDYRPFQKIYPSKSIRATRGAPPLPPIPR
ncbi:WAS/WASL-interacting protein family member 2 isoform X2 [Spea bombifrons]|uniref:WAS/WASL-interacting protein family member 2 isoform X2 n=1 Tax=Spea bombifrons TaxID=233779 RepID=UPI00234A4DF5|nr:WAS/WASL-interacting protein family member 2 isoform X2 [Spea bombifrons]